jgi:hypothetical protein
MKRISISTFIIISLSNLFMYELKAQNGWETYRDLQNRFRFSYPAGFGTPRSDNRMDMPDSDLGETIFFPNFSYGLRHGKQVLEGNLVIRSGRVWVNAQALGGLYDPTSVGALIDAFPTVLQEKLRKQASNLTTVNFCNELSKEVHISINDSSLSNLTLQQKKAITQLDRMRNLEPKVISCKVLGDTVIFHKKIIAKFGQFSNPQHIYGAISFRKGVYSSVQFIRITTDPPNDKLLDTMAEVVRSFEELI